MGIKATLDPHTEALRYLENARETLKKAGKKDGEYADIKYVRTAAGIAYLGVLLAVDAYLLHKEGAKFSIPKSIDDYRIRVARQNKKLLSMLNEVYDELHLAGYYIGTPSVRTIQNGLKTAGEIIAYIE